MAQTVRVAAVQAAPVFLDLQGTVAKTVDLIAAAARGGARIIAFPETFIPGYPHWLSWQTPRSPLANQLGQLLVENAVAVPGPEVAALCAAAREAQAYVVVGINEKRPGTLGTVYNTMLFIDPDGVIRNKHRKLVPTAEERLAHANGDGDTIRVTPTPWGGLGGLICAENGMSLARFTLLQQEERIHVASWPAFATRNPAVQFENIDIRVKYHAFEGRVYVISACSVVTDEMLEMAGLTAEQRAGLGGRGGHSGILGPTGRYIAGPVDDAETIVYADLDMAAVIQAKLMYDPTGHNHRPDLFTLTYHKGQGGP